MTAARYEVQVVNPIDGQPKLWDVYDNREAAEVVASRLRRHGFFAMIRRISDDREAGKALAVWLFGINARTLRETIAAFDRHPEWRSA